MRYAKTVFQILNAYNSEPYKQNSGIVRQSIKCRQDVVNVVLEAKYRQQNMDYKYDEGIDRKRKVLYNEN